MHELSLPTDRPLCTTATLAEKVLADPTATVHAVRAGGGSAALVARRIAMLCERAIIVVTPTLQRARELEADLRLWLGSCRKVWVFDIGEADPYTEVVPDRRAALLRLATSFALARARERHGRQPVVVVPAAALARKVIPTRLVVEAAHSVQVGDEVDRDELVTSLTRTGYLRVPLVEDPGTIAARGSLVDVWSCHLPVPVRIELDGDLVIAIKVFDPADQRTREERQQVWLVPAQEARLGDDSRAKTTLRELCDDVNWPTTKTRALIEDLLLGRAIFGAHGFLPAFAPLEPLFEQLPQDAVLVVEEPAAVQDAIEKSWEIVDHGALQKRGLPHFPAAAFTSAAADLRTWFASRNAVALSANPILGGTGILATLSDVDDDTPSLTTYDQDSLVRAVAVAQKEGGQASGLDPVVAHVQAWRQAGLAVLFVARTVTQAERLALMLEGRGLNIRAETAELDPAKALAPPKGTPTATVVVGALSTGTLLPAEGLAIVTEEEIFGTRAHRHDAKRPGKRQTRKLLEDLRSLAVGDHVVHIEHGIGRYEGLIHRNLGGHTIDMLVVAYSNNDRLYLPVYRLNQIHKLRGGDAKPKLDRLGGQTFSRTKARAKKKVRRIADQLLKLYAERRNATGQPTPPIDDEYRAFEAMFPFEETDDQLRTIAEVSADLEREQPMDRLVCGDVGFGKTEIALRAAFRVVMNGRQVAILCPTTVLAQQHKMTFETRLLAYAMEVRVLSRFQTKKQTTATLAGIKEGVIDVVVGTHRLLSKDVRFKRLGLLVVDEEQRFGVSAKERIKELKTNVNVLTLSATPIPRTLQMAISGLRDLSMMSTPPADRRAVRTIVTRRDTALFKTAVERELSRGGQVFFVYNRVTGLAERARLVQELVPTARVAMAHGQMREAALEKTMLSFVEGELDVLVTTAIIENGLDIPRANTIIIDGAELMGLAQLYQLRGRVGRSKERGYCYLVLPAERAVSDEARTRIEALQRYSDLGSGMLLASLDLDLRGAGDMLGAEQTGTAESVGFDLFCSMLEQVAAEMRGETTVPDVDPELAFDVEALLPEGYIADVGVRLSLYKRLASAVEQHEVDALSEEMQDRFGRPPPSARSYVHLMSLKVELRQLRVLACEASARSVTLHLASDTHLDPVRIATLVKEGSGAYKLTPDMRLTRKPRDGEVFANGIEAATRFLAELDERGVRMPAGAGDGGVTSSRSSRPK